MEQDITVTAEVNTSSDFVEILRVFQTVELNTEILIAVAKVRIHPGGGFSAFCFKSDTVTVEVPTKLRVQALIYGIHDHAEFKACCEKFKDAKCLLTREPKEIKIAPSTMPSSYVRRKQKQESSSQSIPPKEEKQKPNYQSAPLKKEDQKDPYEILGVNKTASKSEIKKAFNKQALFYHPDKAPDDKKEEYCETFKKVHTAYEEATRKAELAATFTPTYSFQRRT